MKVVVGIFVSFILIVVGYFAVQNVLRNWDYSGQSDETVVFVIEKGSGINSIAEDLKTAGVIAATKPFNKVAAGSTINYGSYRLHKKQSSASALAELQDSKNRVDTRITVPEGKSVYQTIGIIINAVPQLSRTVLERSLDQCKDMLPDSAKGNFEGWLFPDTYNFEYGSEPKTLFEAMIDRTKEVLTELKVNEKDYQTVLTKASIVQKETGNKDDMKKVARVIENRLKNKMVLGMDTIIAYGVTKGQYDAGLELKQSDLDDAKSPYNARLVQGLPPTPISNPEKDALTAVLNPADGDWIYFVTTNPKTGETKFGTTEAEFNKFREEYKKWLQENPEYNSDTTGAK